MKEFRVTIGNRPGELAFVAESLAREGVNLKSVCCTAGEKQATLHLIGHDVEATRVGLGASRSPFVEQEVITVLLEDRAGELARLATRLAEAAVNIDAIYLTGKADDLIEFALAVDNVKKAKKILEEWEV